MGLIKIDDFGVLYWIVVLGVFAEPQEHTAKFAIISIFTDL